MKLRYMILTLAGLVSLNSCYFNSAGYLMNKAGYAASSNMADAKIGSTIYSDGTNYYVELPRYRMGRPYRLQVNLRHMEDVGPQATGENDLFQIPADYAMYLAGHASGPAYPTSLTRMDDAAGIKSRATNRLSIVRAPVDFKTDYHYSSSSAALWYTASAFDWLCVDMPVTIVENSLYIFTIAAMAVIGPEKFKKWFPSTDTAAPSFVADENRLIEIMTRGNNGGVVTADEARYVLDYADYLREEAGKENSRAQGFEAAAYREAEAPSPTSGQFFLARRRSSSVDSAAVSQARQHYSAAAELESRAEMLDNWLRVMHMSNRILDPR